MTNSQQKSIIQQATMLHQSRRSIEEIEQSIAAIQEQRIRLEREIEQIRAARALAHIKLEQKL